MTEQKIRKFQNKIWNFYKDNKRNLPWRNTNNLYFILISEVMLQQTQVPRVLHKYEEFLKTFPTIKHLAESSNEDLLRTWSGLGYNRRAFYLKNAAIKLYSNPEITPEHLLTIKGIGPNTAGSIYVFCKNKPYVFIETNIRRVFIFEFFNNKEKIDDKQILSLVEKTLDTKNPREWYYALMDYGTYLAKIYKNPNRKSKHYTKQSKFEGSIRQTRGNILKALLKDKTMNIQDLEEKINSEHFKNALKQLETEQFLKVIDKTVKIS